MTVKQILELEKAGCEIIRVACLDIEDAKAIKEIFLSKVHLTFSLSDRFFNESHSDYIERVIAEAKKQVSLHDVDVFEMTGSMYQSDIK